MVSLPDPLLARRTVLTGTSGAALGIASFALPSSAAAASIEIGSASVAAVGGVVYGWGTEWQSGVFGTQSGSKSAPVEVTGADGFVWPEIVQVAASRYNSFALTKDGDVYSSGTNQDGKLGVTGLAVDSSTVRTTPQQVSISGVVQIASGFGWVLALKADGAVWAWGRDNPASGLATLTVTPIDVTSALWPSSPPSGTDRVVQLSSSIRHSIALTATGRVFTWGQQGFGSTGVLGQGTTADLTSLTAVEIGVASQGAFVGTAGTADQIIQISAGETHSLALGRDGSVYSWGLNNGGAGALGTGLTTNEGAPVKISANGDLANTVGTSARIVQVSAGSNFSLAVGLDGAVYAWGSPSSGRLGNGTTSGNVLVPQRITDIADSALPTLLETSKRIVQVSARLSNGFALGIDSRVYGWGTGGRVGDGTTTQRPLPVEITASGAFANLSPNAGASLAPRRIVALATGDHNDTPHMLAIDDRG
jgi:alpha-tubulin suppressor-like RCC1 family protein